MQLVIADTSPINYLLIVGHIHVLPALFGKVILPCIVREELSHPKAPLAVREWMANPPVWVEVQAHASRLRDVALAGLDAGEEDAIALELKADLLLMDDEEGAAVARAKGFEFTGTLGVLNRAAQQRLLRLDDAFERLKRTNFRYRQKAMDRLLAEQLRQ